MSEMLFDVPEQKSPKLRWMEERGVATRQTGLAAGDEDELGNELFPWLATSGEVSSGGMTEHEAIVGLAVKKRWKLWNEP